MTTSSSSRKRKRAKNTETQCAAASAWSDLPNDLLSLISHRLHPSVDLPRIRAVCKSWRLAIHPAPATIMPIPMLPDKNYWLLHTYFVEESTLYRFEYSNSKSSKEGGEFIARVSASQPSKFLIISPYCYNSVKKIQTFPKKGLNFLDCTVSESKTKYKVFFKGGYSKAAYSAENSTVLLMYSCTLAFIKARKWTKVVGTSNFSGDVTLHNGNFYAINSSHMIIIDPRTMQIIRKMTLPTKSFMKKRFVKSRGDLYVLDQGSTKRKTCRDGYVEKAVDFKIYRFNEYGCRLIYVKTIWDQIVFTSHGSSSYACWIFGKFHLLYR